MKLVDAEQLFCSDCEYKERCKNVTCDVKAMPTIDAVPVVRCRECIHRDGTPGQPNILCGQMHDDDFCSYGQRKEAAHDKHPSDPV